MPFLNGIKVPYFIKDPITASELDLGCLKYWSYVKKEVVRAISGQDTGDLIEEVDTVMDGVSSHFEGTQLIDTSGSVYDN